MRLSALASGSLKEPQDKPSYWSVVGLLLWSIVLLLIAAGMVDLVGHFVFGKW